MIALNTKRNTMARALPERPPERSKGRKIIELRELLASKFPCASPVPKVRMHTGLKVLDNLLGGGLAKAALTEVVCPSRSAGSGTVIQALIEARKARKQPLALVDGGNSFDVNGLENEQLASLLWVQCKGAIQATQVADILLRDNNLSLIVLDLVMCPVREVQAVPSSSWYRLQRVTEGNGSTALIFTPTPVVASATETLRLDRSFELPALDLLRDELTAAVRFKSVHTGSTTSVSSGIQPERFAAG